MLSRYAFLALATLPLVACGDIENPFSRAEQPAAVEGHTGPPTVSPLEQPIETGGAEARPVATVDPATYRTSAFSARGNEPFWAVDAAGGTAIYKTPDNQRGRPIRVDRLAFAGGVEYVGVLNNRPFALTVRSAQCRDDMSGQRFPMTATLKVSGQTLSGCAAPASAEVAAAVAATRAPAPAAPSPTRSRPAPTPAAAPAAASAPASASESGPADTPTTPAAGGTAATPAPTTASPPAPANPDATTTAPAPAPAQTEAPTEAPEADGTPATGVPAPTMTLPATPPTTTGSTPDGATGAATADE